jgi:hypothetical protein
MDYRQKHLVISIGSCWRRAHLSLLLALLIALASGLATALPARATIITISDEPSCQSVGGVWDDDDQECKFESPLTVAAGDVLQTSITVEFRAGFTNDGTIHFGDSTYISNVGFVNNGIITITNRFRLRAEGTNNGTIEVNADGELEISPSSASDAILINQGTINIYAGGELSNNNGSVLNQGTIFRACGGTIVGDPIEGNPVLEANCPPVGTCGGYVVHQVGSIYMAAGWSGEIQVGTNSANTLNGTEGADLLLGLGGNDKLDGKGGDDLLCGGDGVDQLLGGAGTDYLDGGAGNDVLHGGAGDHDRLVGGDGNDTLLDGDGVAEARGGAGNDGFTIALRNGWTYPQGQSSFAGLTAGYGNDTVGLANLGSTAIVLDISGDERDATSNGQEGTTDALTRAGSFTSDSTILKFERQTVTAASAAGSLSRFDGFLVDPTTLTDESGAEFLTEPVGEATPAQQQSLFLPLVTY